MLWKIGFPNDAWRYKKRDRYKRNLEDAIEEKMNTIIETKFKSYMQNLSQETLLELQQVTQNPLSPPLLSSIGSIVALHTWYPIDDITGGTPCRLHISLGRVRNKTKEVAIGVVMPGRIIHNNHIPTEYAKVLVRENTRMSYIEYPPDHVMPERVKELEEAINQFILWNRRENCLRWAGVAKGQGSSTTNVTSASSKVQRSFSATIVTYQGYSPVGTRPPGTRSTTIISLQHNLLGIKPLQAKYSFRPNEQVL
jgi:hypothetical protein